MTPSDTPIMADNKPLVVDLVEGKTYSWCACGRSATQPFCDGSHSGTAFQPLSFTANKKGPAHLCMCKLTKNPPYCDGSHKPKV